MYLNLANPCRFDRPEQSEGSGETPGTLIQQTRICVKVTPEGSLDFARDDTVHEFAWISAFLGEHAIALTQKKRLTV